MEDSVNTPQVPLDYVLQHNDFFEVMTFRFLINDLNIIVQNFTQNYTEDLKVNINSISNWLEYIRTLKKYDCAKSEKLNDLISKLDIIKHDFNLNKVILSQFTEILFLLQDLFPKQSKEILEAECWKLSKKMNFGTKSQHGLPKVCQAIVKIIVFGEVTNLEVDQFKNVFTKNSKHLSKFQKTYEDSYVLNLDSPEFNQDAKDIMANICKLLDREIPAPLHPENNNIIRKSAEKNGSKIILERSIHFSYILRNSDFIKNNFVSPYIKKIKNRRKYELFSEIHENLSKAKDQLLTCDEALNQFLTKTRKDGDISQKLFENQLLLLTGEAGSGKSTIMKYFEYMSYTNHKIIPLYYPLFDLPVNNIDVDNFLLTLLKQYQTDIEPYFTKEFFIQELQNQNILLILDGLDEYASKNALYDFFEIWIEFLNNFIKNFGCKIILSIRSTALPFNLPESIKNLFEVQIWDLDLIYSWLEKNLLYFNPKVNEKVENILLKIEQTYPLMDLCRNPFLLVAYIEIYHLIAKNEILDRVTLYHLIIHKRLSDNYEKIKDTINIPIELILNILRILAIHFFRHNEINFDINIINIEKFTFLPLDHIRILTDLITDKEKIKILYFFLKNNSLLSGNDQNAFNFSHQTFAEFLIADLIKDEIQIRTSKLRLQYFNQNTISIETLSFLDEFMQKNSSLSFELEDFLDFFDIMNPPNDPIQKWIFTKICQLLGKDLLWKVINEKLINTKSLDLSELELSVASFQKPFQFCEKIDLSGNSFISINSIEFTFFPALKYLNFAHNQIICDKEDKKPDLTLDSLEYLNLSLNSLNSIPFIVLSCPNLLELNLSHNKIHELPELLFNKSNKIQKLILRENHLIFLPKSIESCQNLKILDLKNNKIKEFPKHLSKITGIQSLNLSENELSDIPAEIGDLQDLRYLFLEKNRIRTLSSRIGLLKNVEMLYLYKNQLKILPETIGDLKSLKNLGLYKNKLTHYPKSICNLSALEILYSGDNLLESLPEEIGKMKSLKILNLKENELTTIPISIGLLSNLKSLYLYENQLISIPGEIVNCFNLDTLILWGNRLRNLPDKIGDLKKLANLEIKDNYIMKLPSSIIELINLKNLTMENNNFIDFHQDILRWLAILELRKCNISL